MGGKFLKYKMDIHYYKTFDYDKRSTTIIRGSYKEYGIV